MRRVVIGSLQAILSCNFTALDEAMFRHRFVAVLWTHYLSLSMIPFKKCIMWQKNLAKCIPLLVSSCKRSSVVTVKVIRLHMSLVEELMIADPGLRVIHLVRDPRGIMQSWRKVSRPKMSEEKMQVSASIACKRMLQDCDIRQRLEEMFPGRILLVRYEDLVTNTQRVLRNIYTSLLQLPVPNSVIKALVKQIKADSDDGSAGTKRIDGKATAYKWKQEIDRQHLDYVNSVCGSIISLLKYDRT